MFDLNEAIDHWKKILAKSRAIQDGDLTELEGYLRDKIEDLLGQGHSEEEAFRSAETEFARARDLDRDFYRAQTDRRGGRPPWQPPRFMPALFWNYFKIALRKIQRQKGYSALTITGLALGLACCILVILFVRYERSFDRYHTNARDIYRLVAKGGRSKTSPWNAVTPGLLKSAMMQDFPEILRASRVKAWESTIRKNDRAFREENFFIVDPEFLDMFTFPLVAGDPRTALKEPYSLLLTEAAARKYFDRANPLGQTLSVDQQDYRITGILKNPPPNSHFLFDFLASFGTLYALQGADRIDNWNQSSFYTYVQLRKDAPPADLEKKLPAFSVHRIEAGYRSEFRLQALTDIHLRSALNFEIGPNGDIRYVYLLSAFGVFILLIACLNYMNLATARAARCAREIGLRKVVGADRRQIIRQFLGESVVYSVIAIGLALILVSLAIPLFNALSGRSLSLSQLSGIGTAALLAALTVIVGLAAGSYPALYLSSFRPILILKGAFRENRKRSAGFRRALVMGQFVISIALMASTLIVHHQLRFIRDKKLGFVQNQIVTVPLGDDRMKENPESLREALRKNPRVSGVAFSSELPHSIRSSSFIPAGDPGTGQPLSLFTVDVDPDFLELYGLRLRAGRKFSRRFTSDAAGATILNDAARTALGPSDPVGRPLAIHNYPRGPVVGVVEDFHFSPLTKKIAPLAINILPRFEGRYFSIQYVSIKIDREDEAGTLDFIAQTFKRLMPESPFSYSFLEDQIEAMYRSERKLGQTFDDFAFLAVFIACLGLLGLASYVAERRTKEIGVRRVLGASVIEIAVLLNREFLTWVAASAVIACPIAFFGMQIWVRKFAYRAPWTPWTFILATAAAMAAALLTTGWQTLKAAGANPVKTLNNE